ncbi:hypothetical protein AGABI2DRAFT_145832 [Agaricus bisporus var. bisporus H97]|uniref:hypothetical protein n=1 Tax=Agaricus bisporus var. bisporus (strain H97 / ATCC MYA-4626 / FGSC 10389) TaxID=936046 RepID=UPI00029F8019|nr:hypothetical protein AGABI2DRAFT_145832 [Agaricus bisporus var. bisporus H97]EKV43576.1 hypothetical protein AGABI2DRAFT_145832 [Agaricus bisporus var. bisporus H97]
MSFLASILAQYPPQPHYEMWRQQQMPPPPFQYATYPQQPQAHTTTVPYRYIGHVPYIPQHQGGGYHQHPPPPPPSPYQQPMEADDNPMTRSKGKRRATEQDEAQEYHEQRVETYARHLCNAGVSDIIINSLDLYTHTGINAAEELIQQYEGQRSSMRSMESKLDRLQGAVERLLDAQTATTSHSGEPAPSRSKTPVGYSLSNSSRARPMPAQGPSVASQPVKGKGKRKAQPVSPPSSVAGSSKAAATEQKAFFARPLSSKLAPTAEPTTKRHRQGSTTNSNIAQDPEVPPTTVIPNGLTLCKLRDAPIGKNSPSCNYGDLVRVKMPGQLPPKPPVTLDRSKPEDYRVTPSNACFEESELEGKSQRKKKRSQGPVVVTESPLDGISDLPGQGGVIPDLWGMATDEIIGPDHMQDNRMQGMLSQHVFHDPYTNVVYAGQTAIRAAEAALRHKRFEAETGSRTIRNAAPSGLPQSPLEAGRLLRLARDHLADSRVRTEAYILLTELHTIALQIAPRHTDNAMEYILAEFRTDEIPEPIRNIRRNWGEILRNWPAARLSNPSNNTGGMGMAQPTGAALFDLDLLGRYLLTHNRPGSQNYIHGTQFDYRRAVHCRSVFGYTLARFFGPPETGRGRSRNGHVVFTRCFTILAASPQLYRDLIAQWNERHPDQLFIPQTGPFYHFRPLEINDSSIANLNVDTIAEVLTHNGVPPSWVDHAYNFGLRYMDQVYTGSLNHQSSFDSADDEQVCRLDVYGDPPTIPLVKNTVVFQ